MTFAAERSWRPSHEAGLCLSCIELGFPFCYALFGKAAYDLNACH
jgi:hypothetical protein